MLLISFFVLFMYLIMMVVEHYQCNTKTGLDITTKVKIGIELGLFSLILEIINSHVILVYMRFLLFKEVKKWGFYSQSDLRKYRMSFCIDFYLKLFNLFLVSAQCLYFRNTVPDNCL